MMSRSGDERIELPELEVVPKEERGQFTSGQKLPILEEAEACTEPDQLVLCCGEKGYTRRT